MSTAPIIHVIDPTWPCETGGGRVKRGADRHYALAKNITALAQHYVAHPLWRVEHGLIWMWATNRALVLGEAHTLMKAIAPRARVVTAWEWVKAEQHHGGIGYTLRRKPGLGQWQRTDHEHLLLARIGKVSVPPPSARTRSVIFAPTGAHSVKPQEAWRVIETVTDAVLPHARRIEWNARSQRAGWSAVGALEGEHRPIVSAAWTEKEHTT